MRPHPKQLEAYPPPPSVSTVVPYESHLKVKLQIWANTSFPPSGAKGSQTLPRPRGEKVTYGFLVKPEVTLLMPYKAQGEHQPNPQITQSTDTGSMDMGLPVQTI